MHRRSNKKSFKKARNNTKKKTTSYKEQCPEKVEKYLSEISGIPKEDIIYLDETGIENYIYREYARAPRGEKVHAKISGRKYKRTNIVAGRCGEKNIAPFIYDGNMDKNLFEFWFVNMFLDEIAEGKIIVMDNASFHCKNRLYKLCKESNKNLKLIFLPPYSPELNPIEKYWAILKRKVKKFIKYDEGFIEQLCKLL
ncbi:MAG: IS630 family transposase [Clostridium sp.]